MGMPSTRRQNTAGAARLDQGCILQVRRCASFDSCVLGTMSSRYSITLTRCLRVVMSKGCSNVFSSTVDGLDPYRHMFLNDSVFCRQRGAVQPSAVALSKYMDSTVYTRRPSASEPRLLCRLMWISLSFLPPSVSKLSSAVESVALKSEGYNLRGPLLLW